MHTVFIVNNLKVSPFLLYDGPVPGCELLTYENESYTKGSLWDIGPDAAFYDGAFTVRGQLWKIHTSEALGHLSLLLGEHSGLTQRKVLPVTIDVDDVKVNIDAIVFRLTQVSKSYKLVETETWQIKRT